MAIKNINKKGMLARDFIIILILFSLVAGIGYLIAADMASSEHGYNVENMTDPNFQARYNQIQNTTARVYQMQNATLSKEGMSIISTFTTMFRGTFSVISLVFESIGLAHSTIVNFAEDAGIPSVLANMLLPALITILIVILVFVVISSVSRGRL